MYGVAVCKNEKNKTIYKLNSVHVDCGYLVDTYIYAIHRRYHRFVIGSFGWSPLEVGVAVPANSSSDVRYGDILSLWLTWQ